MKGGRNLRNTLSAAAAAAADVLPLMSAVLE